MPYRYLEHVGDAAIEGSGKTLEEAFAGAAAAMLGLMVRGAETPAPGRRVRIEARAQSLEELLVEFLNELLSRQGLLGLLFTRCEVAHIGRAGGAGFMLEAEAEGAPPEALAGRLGTEVKGASYLGLRVERRNGGYLARVVLDL
ncbi:MAG: archease [Candidatus Aureabacteria bacterium]|nr:archease [Candidatus Auribacterota bacterium]NLW93152.1 archease [Chlamydiota bacterium]HOE28029.1 archease [bacterium]HQM52486.1 archease [bacterium]